MLLTHTHILDKMISRRGLVFESDLFQGVTRGNDQSYFWGV